MDTKNDGKIAQPDCLKAVPRQKIVVGVKQLSKALASDRISRVFVAENADPALTEPLTALCRQKGVVCTPVSSMRELGQLCGIDVAAAAAAILR